ncbi:MAG: PorT family protein [Bacteroidales bacterium]|nr:PorT family protein [Bacteroidales bacterium]MCL2133793.1 PorT family protein [Bacteroidales bacterium]
MKQKVITLILVSCICCPLLGQHRHEFSINAGGGLSTLNFKPTTGKFSNGFGGEAGLGYHFLFSPKWSIGTGLNLALYNSSVILGNYNKTVNAKSASNRSFRLSYSFVDYEEDVSAMLLTIPLMVQFQTGEKIGFYVAGGGKVGLPFSAKYTTTAERLTTNGYFSDIMVTYDEDLPQYAFGSYQKINQKTDMNLKPVFLLSAEAGAKWRFNNTMCFYAGAYIDYGINNIKKDKPVNLLDYDSQATSYPSGFVYNGVANTLSSKITSLAIGVKFRLNFSSSIFSKVRPSTPVEE